MQKVREKCGNKAEHNKLSRFLSDQDEVKALQDKVAARKQEQRAWEKTDVANKTSELHGYANADRNNLAGGGGVSFADTFTGDHRLDRNLRNRGLVGPAASSRTPPP